MPLENDERRWEEDYPYASQLDGSEGDEPVPSDESTEELRDRPLTFVPASEPRANGTARLAPAMPSVTKRGQASSPPDFVARQEGARVSVSFNSNHYSGRARYAGSA